MRRVTKLFVVICCVLLVAGSVFARGSSESEAVKVKSDTLKIALESPIAGMDPKTTVDRYSGNVYGCIYEPLLIYDEDNNIVANTIVEKFSQIDAIPIISSSRRVSSSIMGIN